MLVKFPDGNQVNIGTTLQKITPTSSAGAIITFADLLGTPSYAFTCFSMKEQADMVKAIEDALAAGLPFLNLTSQAALPAAGNFTLTPNTGAPFTAIEITTPVAAPLAVSMKPDALITLGAQVVGQFRYVNASTLSVIAPFHASGVVDMIYRDSRGSVTVVGAWTYP